MEQSPAECPEEGAQFLVHVGGVRKGVGDFVAEEEAVALAEAMDGDADCTFFHPEALG